MLSCLNDILYDFLCQNLTVVCYLLTNYIRIRISEIYQFILLYLSIIKFNKKKTVKKKTNSLRDINKCSQYNCISISCVYPIQCFVAYTRTILVKLTVPQLFIYLFNSKRSISGNRMKLTNLYARLGLNRNATQADIKSAYYKLSKMYHPDKNSGCSNAAIKFRDVAEAYEILGNAKSRKVYDRGKFTCISIGIFDLLWHNLFHYIPY